MLLDAWIGPESITWLREQELREVLQHHARNRETEVSTLEAIGAVNFLALDDVAVGAEGEILDPRSIVELRFRNGSPVFPKFVRDPGDSFLRSLEVSGKKWVVVVDENGVPQLVLDAHAFLRDALFGGSEFEPMAHTHRPLVVRDSKTALGEVLGRLTVRAEWKGDDVIDRDIILVWTGDGRRIITGSDILGRLLRGIARPDDGDSGHAADAAGESRTAHTGSGARDAREGGRE